MRRFIEDLLSRLTGELQTSERKMAWRSHGADNQDMVANLFSNGIIKSEVVKDAMLKVDRGSYSPHNPYMDAPQRIGSNVTISAPHMHAHALGEPEAWHEGP